MRLTATATADLGTAAGIHAAQLYRDRDRSHAGLYRDRDRLYRNCTSRCSHYKIYIYIYIYIIYLYT